MVLDKHSTEMQYEDQEGDDGNITNVGELMVADDVDNYTSFSNKKPNNS
jgi:hypothetical protein